MDASRFFRTPILVRCIVVGACHFDIGAAYAGTLSLSGFWTAGTPQTTKVPSIPNPPGTPQTSFTAYNGGTYDYTLGTFAVDTTGTYNFALTTTNVVHTSWFLTGTFAPSASAPTTPIGNFFTGIFSGSGTPYTSAYTLTLSAGTLYSYLLAYNSSSASLVSAYTINGSGVGNICQAGLCASTVIDLSQGSFNENSSAAQRATIEFNGGTFRPTTSVTVARPLTLDAAGGTVDTATAPATTLSGAIAGPGGLTTTGAGTVILTGADSHTGGTTIASGTLQVGAGGTAGTLAGNVVDNGTLAFNRSDAVTFGGAISGSGALRQDGAGTLTLTGTNSYTGGTSVTSGTLALGNASALGTGALSLNEGTTLAFTGDMVLSNAISFPQAGDPIIDTGANSVTIASAITGVGDLSKIGTGTLDLTGVNTYTGATDVVQGTLLVDNATASSIVTVENGAVLGGTGTVGGIRVLAGATVAPGAAVPYSILHVAGNVAFAAGSTYRVQVNAAGQTDAIVATGTAVLNGGTVDVLGAGGTYTPTTSYRILTAAAGRTGQFASLATTTNLAFLTPVLSYDATGVNLGFTRTVAPAGPTAPGVVTFPSIAATANERASAAAIEALGQGSLYGAVLSQTAAGARTAFNGASGEIHASAVTASIEDTRVVRNAIFGRLDEAAREAPVGALGAVAAFGAPQAGLPQAAQGYAPVVKGQDTPAPRLATLEAAPAPYTIWGAGFGDFGRNGGNGNAAALDRSLGGFVLGADAKIDAALFSRWRFGVAGGYTSDDLRVGNRASTGSFETYFGGLYAGALYGPLDIKLGVLGGGTQTNTRRTIAFPGFLDTAHASYGGAIVQGFGELGYRIGYARGFIEPVFQGAAIHIDQDRYREQGGAAALIGLGRATDVETTTLGLKGETSPFAAYPVTARAFIGWRHAYGDVDPRVLAAFTGGATPFAIAGAPIDRDAVVAEAGLDYHASRALTLGVSYTGQAGSRAYDNGVKGRLEYRF